MKTYKIIKNNYLIGKAKGKKNAVDAIISDLTVYPGVLAQWHKNNGRIICLNAHNEYIVDIDKGD